MCTKKDKNLTLEICGRWQFSEIHEIFCTVILTCAFLYSDYCTKKHDIQFLRSCCTL